MRREHFRLDVRNIDWVEDGGEPQKPAVLIEVTGSREMLRERLIGPGGELLAASEIDVALRLKGPVAGDTPGVVAVTNRVTGEFILELNEDAGGVLTFISAARGYGEDCDADEGRYEVEVWFEGEDDPLAVYDKQTFLVYDDEGSLLRQHSLIPSGVEL